MKNILSPNLDAIKQHINFLFGDMRDYDDGLIELAYTPAIGGAVNRAEYFGAHELEEAASRAYELNKTEGVNVYIGAALRDPSIAPFGRSNISDYYAASCVWVDLDEPGTVEAAKELYKDCPPSFVVVTGRTPDTRAQYWWKLDEAQLDHEDLKDTLAGLCSSLNGDKAVVDPARVMRLGGTVAWPKKDGRVPELTETHIPKQKTEFVPLWRIQEYFPRKDDFLPLTNLNPAGEVHHKEVVSHFDDRLIDGRDKFMSDMIFASIINLTGDLKRWPEPQEVFEDCWQAYANKVTSRDKNGLEAEGRGQKHMAQKINAKLRSFKTERFGTVEKFIQEKKEAPQKTEPSIEVNDTEVINKETGEIISGTFDLIYASDITPSLEVRDFIEDVLSEEQISVVYGESNCGKTFFMLDMAMHVALNRQWRGKEIEGGGVIYIALEGARGTLNRVAAFKKHYNVQNDINLAIIPSNVDLMNAQEDVAKLINTIKSASEKIGGVKLVVVDTLARAMAGADENSGQDMSLLVDHADTIKAATGAHVSFVHHSGKDAAKGARGHSSLRAAVDTEIEISRKDKDSQSLIRIVKQREVEMIDDMAFTLEAVELGENRRGKQVTSCVVVPVDVIEESRDIKLTPVQRFIYDAIVDAIIRFGAARRVIKGQEPIKSITYSDMNEVLEERGYRTFLDTKTSSGSEKMKNHTTNARVALQKKGKINFANDYIWMAENG